MSKKALLYFALALTLMLTGVGYAYWTDQITVAATVNTGTFDVRFVENAGEMVLNYTMFDEGNILGTSNVASVGDGAVYTAVGAIPEEGITGTRLWYVEPQVDGTQDDDKITFTFNNLYPGCAGEIIFAVGNYGTIPASLESCTISAVSADPSKDFSSHFYLGWEYARLSDDVISPVSDLVPLGTLGEIVTNNNSFKSLVLDVGDYDEASQGDIVMIRVPFEFKDENASEQVVGAEDFEGASLQITISMTWKQWNITPQ